MEIKGKVIQVMTPLTGTGKKGQWKKQEFIIETQAQYPKKVCLALWGDKECPTVGSLITASLELESREYNGKWFTEARAWKLEITQRGRGQSAPPPQDPKQYEQSTGFIADSSGSEDLPF
jgi:hypothetical protein